MTIYQIIALIIAGPIAFIQIFQVYAVVKGIGTFTILQATSLFICITAILVAFLGIV